MKRKASFILIYAALVLLGGLGAYLLLFGAREPRASLTENRMLAGFPELTRESVRQGTFMSGLEDFLSDNMLERDELVAQADGIMERLALPDPQGTGFEDDPVAAQVADSDLDTRFAAWTDLKGAVDNLSNALQQGTTDAEYTNFKIAYRDFWANEDLIKRDEYHKLAADYNGLIGSFPGGVVASVVGQGALNTFGG